MAEKPPTPEELRQAESLARALEGDGSAEDIPDDALAAASLLRYRRDAGALPADRKDGIRQEILEAARISAEARPVGGSRRWLLAPAGGLAAAAAALLLMMVLSRPAVPPAATELPQPTAALLRAQMEAAEGDPVAIAQLSTQMRSYRGQVVDTLSRRYAVTQ